MTRLGSAPPPGLFRPAHGRYYAAWRGELTGPGRPIDSSGARQINHHREMPQEASEPMKNTKLVLIAVLGLALIVFVVQNTAAVEARFLWFNSEIPMIVLLLLTAAGAFVLGLLVTFFVRGGSKPKP